MILRQHYNIILATSLDKIFLYIGQSHDNWFDYLKYKTAVCKKNCSNVFLLNFDIVVSLIQLAY